MQCRALTSERKRCPAESVDGGEYCAAHRDEMERAVGKRATSSSGWRNWLDRFWHSNAQIPDGASYDVPGWLKDAPTPRVIEHLQTHSDSMARWMSAFVLRKRRAVEALDALWHARQNDSVRFVRQQSAVALGKIGAPAVYAPLVEGLHHDPDPGVREACAIALGNLGNPAAVDEIVRALEREENVFVRWDCIVALGQLGDHRVEKLLRRLEAEEIAQVLRAACRDALEEIRQREKLPTRTPATD